MWRACGELRFLLEAIRLDLMIYLFLIYSSVPNRRAVRNKRAGGKILKKTLNVQDRIEVQGEKFSAKSIIVQGENKRAGGN